MAVGVAKSAGFVSAVFLGKVAMLPFKSESSPHIIKIFHIKAHIDKLSTIWAKLRHMV